MPLEFIYNTDYTLTDEKLHSAWIKSAIFSENYGLGNIVFAFFNDEEVKKLNKKFLNKDYYTDVISFNETNDKIISGNIAISVDRVKENSKKFKCTFQDEMRRVMIHGLLHFMGYKDESDEEISKIRKMEDLALGMFHVKH